MASEESEVPEYLQHSMPKEKIWFIPSNYFTMILIGIFVVSILGGIIFIASKTANDQTSNTSIPLASGDSQLSAPATPNPTVTPKATQSLGPTLASAKPTPKPTAKPTATPTPSTSPSPTPSPTSSSSSTNSSQNVKLYMDPSGLNKSVNDTFNIDLKLDPNGDQVSTVEIHLKYDQNKLQYQSLSPNSSLVVLQAEQHNAGDGTASIVLGSSPGSPVTSAITAATVSFKAIGSGASSVNYDSGTQTNSVGKSGNTIQSTTNANVQVN